MKIENMKNIIISLLVFFGCCVPGFGQVAPTNFDYGLFAPGTYGANPANAVFEVAIKPDMVFPSVPAAAELNFYLTVPAVLLNGSETFGVAESQVSGGSMIYQSDGYYEHPDDGKAYLSFVYNGSGINLSTFAANVWTHIFTITISGLTTAGPGNFTIADALTDVYNDFGIRTALNVLGFNEFYLLSSEPVLPLELLKFEAKRNDTRSAVLNWSTTSELNTNHFAIQRSINGVAWSDIGKVKATNDYNGVSHYSFLDKDVYDGRSTIMRYYYRLLIVDNDGKSANSNIEVVVFGKDALRTSVKMFPNPSIDKVYVEMDYDEESILPAEIVIYNNLGQIVHKQDIPERSVFEQVDFAKANIHSGTYTLKIFDSVNGLITTEKLVVQR